MSDNGLTDQSVSGAKAMAKILKLTKALDDAKALAKSAEASHKAAPTLATRAAYLGALATVIGAAKSLAKADPRTAAKMTKITEKYSEKKERLEETDMEEEEGEASSAMSREEEEEAMDSESDNPSTERSSGEESEEEEEEERGAAEEEEEEEAIAHGWRAAAKAYARETKGIDAYGVFGPKGAAKALRKATGETSIRGALGALAALPRAGKTTAKIAADVERLKADADREKIEAIITEAKADGRAPTKALRAEMREIGAKMGARYLKGFAASLPKVARTTEAGPLRAKLAEGGNDAPTADAQMASILDTMTAGMTAEQKSKFAADFAARMAKSNTNGATPKA